MSRWKEAFDQHPIHTTLKRLREWDDAYDGDSAEVSTEFRRFIKVINTITSVVENLDAEFYDQGKLDQLNATLNHGNIINNLNSFNSSQSLSHIQSANNHLSNCFQFVQYLAISNSENTSLKYVQKVEDIADGLAATTEQTTKQASEELENIRSTISTLEKKASELKHAQEKLASNYETRTTTWENSFAEAEAERTKSNTELENKFLNQHAELIRKHEEEFDSRLKSLNDAQIEKSDSYFEKQRKIVVDHLVGIKAIHSKVRELHGLVSEDSVSGTYKSSAKEEKLAAERWRSIAMCFFIASAVWLAVKFYLTMGTTSVGANWPELATAASLTAVLLGAGTYASKQSKSHRDNERELMWFSLEIQAFEPFIASLGEDEKKALRAELTAKLFGRNQKSERPLENLNPKELSDLLSTVLSPIKDLLKK